MISPNYVCNSVRRRVYLDLTGQEKKVDDSSGNDTDVNRIVERYQRTGKMPEGPSVPPVYMDVTDMQGDLTEIIEKGKEAQKTLTELKNADQAKVKQAAEDNVALQKRIQELETLLAAEDSAPGQPESST